jgi:hypothetical protein
MIKIAIAFALVQAAGAVEPLPLDERMAEYEALFPDLRQVEARIEAEIGRLGPVEPGWEMSGLTPQAAISAQAGNEADHVLGEWEVGGHGVVIPGDRPLALPEGHRRYSIREYGGRVDYHIYHRAVPGIVFHTVGIVRRIGNAECLTTLGMEIVSREAWQDWPEEAAFTAFAAARMTRDDRRTYCMIYRAAGSDRFEQLAYTPEGRPYLVGIDDGQRFVVTPRAVAATRIFE